jgi:hypothetical protein
MDRPHGILDVSMNLTPFLNPSFVEHPVGAEAYKFYPVSLRVLFQLRGLAKPIAQAISTLLTSRSDDIGRESVEVKAPDGGTQLRTTIQPIQDSLAKTRFDQRASTLNALIDQLMSEGAANMIATLIMDSMRDLFPNRTPSAADCAKFVAEVPAERTMEMLAGVAKANKKLFDPLKVRVVEAATTLRAAVANIAAENGLQPEPPKPQ